MLLLGHSNVLSKGSIAYFREDHFSGGRPLNTFEHPVIEVHISNVHQREPFRHHSYISRIASGVIAGFGTQGYLFAVERLANLISQDRDG